VTSAASAGGAAGASGVGLQNRVFAWAAAAMAAEWPLMGLDVAGTVVRVGAQTGFALDDVAAQTDTGCFALFQVKVGLGLGLGEAADSPLAGALKQAVEQFANGRLPVGDGADRPVDAGRDALVLCTDRTAPATVRDDLRTALPRTGSQPPGTQLGHELTVNQRKALNVVVAHVRPMWEAATGKVAGAEDLRGAVPGAAGDHRRRERRRAAARRRRRDARHRALARGRGRGIARPRRGGASGVGRPRVA